MTTPAGRDGRLAGDDGRGQGTGGRPASAIRSVAALVAWDLRLALRRGENLLVTIVIPAVILLFFSTVGILPAVAGRPVDFLLPGSIALAIIATCLVSLGISTGYERTYGVLKRLGGAPVPRAGLIVSRTLSVLVIVAAQVAMLVAIAAIALEWRLPPGTSLPLLGAAIALGGLAFAGLGLLLAGTLRAEATLAIANGLFLAFLLLGGLIIPIDHLPPALAAVAVVLPAAQLGEVLRIGLGQAGDPLTPLAALLGWGVVMAGLAVRAFRWE